MTCHRRHSSHSVSSRQEDCHRLAGVGHGGGIVGGDGPTSLHGTSENQQNKSKAGKEFMCKTRRGDEDEPGSIYVIYINVQLCVSYFKIRLLSNYLRKSIYIL